MARNQWKSDARASQISRDTILAGGSIDRGFWVHIEACRWNCIHAALSCYSSHGIRTPSVKLGSLTISDRSLTFRCERTI